MRVLFALLALAVTVSAQGLTGPNFYITKTNAAVSYIFSINNTEVEDPSLTLTVGTTYKFILNASMPNHALGFSLDNAATITLSNLTAVSDGGVTTSGSCAVGGKPNSWYTTDAANPCIISLTPPANAVTQPLYYRCFQHAEMVGTLTAVVAGGSTTSPPTGTTTSPPTGTTTQAPTTTAPPTSTGKNDAAVILPGAAALVVAAINALFSA